MSGWSTDELEILHRDLDTPGSSKVTSYGANGQPAGPPLSPTSYFSWSPFASHGHRLNTMLL